MGSGPRHHGGRVRTCVAGPKNPRHTVLAVDTEARRREYVNLCGKLENSTQSGFDRWRVFVDIALCRSEILRCQVPHCYISTESDESGELAARSHQLASTIMRHFGDRRFDMFRGIKEKSVANLSGALDTSIGVLRAQRWIDSYNRVSQAGFKTCQEDVLIQELSAIGEVHRELGRIAEFVSWVRVARARDNAVASLIRLTGPSFREEGAKVKLIASVGAGLGQFEELLARKSCARIVASDVEKRPAHLDEETSIEFIRSEAGSFIGEIETGSVGLLIAKDVLHHISDPDAFLEACHAKVAPSGRILAIEPVFGEAEPDDLRALQELDATPYKSNFRTIKGWSASFRAAGFGIVGGVPLAPGVLDNNDSFPRHAWTLKKCTKT